ncbi:MAG: 4-hydroxy-tetrahydrodipicolinate reductase [Rikenellaceae bacterium]|jgi:4-hydroxy-tetrahydrodipicolinate reductase|nr:4-hydroxy-tetrahydrodipicolinate reductase [Rikenellaceae bacterium]
MNVAIVGYGKMGHEIARLLLARGHKIQLIVDVDNVADLNAEKLRGCDVAIEFSAPDAAFANVCKCIEAGVPVVCGTTAWLDKLDQVKKLCAKHDGAFFYASNYSLGVNIAFRVNRMLAEMMDRFPQYDVTVEETHHTQKKDAPSGTAITLAEDIVAALGRKRKWVGEPTITPDHLGVTSVRRSVVPGTHIVTYESDHDYITLTHCAKSRAGFVQGAVTAAEFIAGRKGVYTMDDLFENL